jgi:hypothetical protein
MQKQFNSYSFTFVRPQSLPKSIHIFLKGVNSFISKNCSFRLARTVMEVQVEVEVEDIAIKFASE